MSRRAIPAVDKVLRALANTGLPRPLVVAEVRRELTKLRRALTGESTGARAKRKESGEPDFDAIVARIRERLEEFQRSRLQPVINATGVIIHTNLGRAPLGPEIAEALTGIATNYNNLEFDLTVGRRGQRGLYIEHALTLLCGAQAATVVNNCAAALVLMLRHFTRGARKEVIISRGELVQIGGGFRVPDILETSGATLREVGATNRTNLDDYARAIGPRSALILKVHRSNFFMGGFVESPATNELAALARKKRVPFVEDLGSGAVMGMDDLGLAEHEPTPAESLKQGVDLVCFSGDKLLGGPQAGIIAGKARLVKALKRDPFFRALRCDKLILAALQGTVEACLDSGADGGEPLAWTLIRTPLAGLRDRAAMLRAALADLPVEVRVTAGMARVGGGTLPKAEIESITLDLRPRQMPVGDLATRLCRVSPPVIGHVVGGWLKLDLRTVFPSQDQSLVAILSGMLTAAHQP